MAAILPAAVGSEAGEKNFAHEAAFIH